MIRFYLLLWYLSTTTILLAQNSPGGKFQEEKYLKEIYKDDNQHLWQAFTFIGLYEQAMFLYDTSIGDWMKRMVIDHFSDTLVNVADAKPLFLKAVRENNIIILNDGHDLPFTRVFLYKMLDSLVSLGVNSFFFETYNSGDSSFSTLGYPTTNTGFYSQEIIFSEVLRKLHRMLIPVYGYESQSQILDTIKKNTHIYITNKQDPSWIPIAVDSFVLNYYYDNVYTRYVHQAINIYQVAKRKNLEKIFIFSGQNNGVKNRGFLGNILMHIFEQTPYVIDQTTLHEHSNPKYELPLYIKYSALKEPFTPIDEQGNPIGFKNLHGETTIDMSIGTPRTVYVKNRPTWLELAGEKYRYNLSNYVDTSKVKNDFLVTIYNQGEFEHSGSHAIPVDIFQVSQPVSNYDLILRPQRQYRMIIYQNKLVVLDTPIKTL